MILNRKQAIEEAPPHREIYEEFIGATDFRSERTMTTYKGCLGRYIRFLEAMNIDKPKESSVSKFKKSLRDKGCHGATIQLYVVVLKKFYKWTERMGYYPNISLDLQNEKIDPTFKRQALTLEEANKLLDCVAAESTKGIQQLRDYTLIYVILNLGLRTVEASRADFEDIRQEGEFFYLYVQGKGHVEKDESIRLPESVLQVINDYRSARKVEKGPMFINHGHNKPKERIEPKFISRIVKHYLKEIHINRREITAHSLRHTCATLALARGATMEEVRQLLRHKSIETTQIYLHMTNKTNNRSQSLVNEVLHTKKINK